MKRYYICDILGDGSDTDPTPTTGPFRPAVADLGVNWVGAIPTHPEGHPDHGKPVHTWTLVMVAGKDHAKLRDVPGVDPLPDFPMDGRVSAINQATRTEMEQAITRRGIASSVVTGKDGYRDIVRAIGQTLEPTFDENNFDISDV